MDLVMKGLLPVCALAMGVSAATTVREADVSENVAAAPLSIDVGRQLFVDDALIASTQGLVRTFYLPQKMGDAPVMWPQTDQEREVDPSRKERWAPSVAATDGGLWWDPHRKVFRLWYESGWEHRLSYAESEDGVNWKRPDCGVVPGTNALLPEHDVDTWVVIPDYASADPYSNWRLMYSWGNCEKHLYTAEDGIHWRHVGDTGPGGDRTTMFYDPFRSVWVFSIRGQPRFLSRTRSRWDSPTFGGPSCQWSCPWKKGDPGKYPGLKEPKPWMPLDEKDLPDLAIANKPPQLYNFDAVAYESIMVGVAEILHPHPRDNDSCRDAGMPKITDLQFAYSRNGWDYERPDRRAAIPASRWGSGRWDSGYLSPIGGICVIKDERLWFYYTGMRGDATQTKVAAKYPEYWRPCGMHFNACIGVATLRRDGFAGMVADGRGELVTRDVVFSGGHLFVNADCRFGSLTAEALDENGVPIKGFEAEACRTLALRDETKVELSWKGADLKTLAGRPVRFRFRLHCGVLYSFWVSPSARGESRGWLAAGGPAYSGLRDL